MTQITIACVRQLIVTPISDVRPFFMEQWISRRIIKDHPLHLYVFERIQHIEVATEHLHQHGSVVSVNVELLRAVHVMAHLIPVDKLDEPTVMEDLAASEEEAVAFRQTRQEWFELLPVFARNTIACLVGTQRLSVISGLMSCPNLFREILHASP